MLVGAILKQPIIRKLLILVVFTEVPGGINKLDFRGEIFKHSVATTIVQYSILIGVAILIAVTDGQSIALRCRIIDK